MHAIISEFTVDVFFSLIIFIDININSLINKTSTKGKKNNRKHKDGNI